MSRIPLQPDLKPRTSTGYKDARLVNAFVEKSQTGVVRSVKRPGMFVGIAGAGIPGAGIFSYEGTTYVWDTSTTPLTPAIVSGSGISRVVVSDVPVGDGTYRFVTLHPSLFTGWTTGDYFSGTSIPLTAGSIIHIGTSATSPPVTVLGATTFTYQAKMEIGLTALGAGTFSATISVGGGRVVFMVLADSSRGVLFSAGGGATVFIDPPIGYATVSTLSVSPDGKWVTFFLQNTADFNVYLARWSTGTGVSVYTTYQFVDGATVDNSGNVWATLLDGASTSQAARWNSDGSLTFLGYDSTYGLSRITAGVPASNRFVGYDAPNAGFQYNAGVWTDDASHYYLDCSSGGLLFGATSAGFYAWVSSVGTLSPNKVISAGFLSTDGTIAVFRSGPAVYKWTSGTSYTQLNIGGANASALAFHKDSKRCVIKGSGSTYYEYNLSTDTYTTFSASYLMVDGCLLGSP